MNASRLTLLVLAALGLAACADPGCIRNSECATNELCIEHACVVPRSDAGVSRENDGGSDAQAATPR